MLLAPGSLGLGGLLLRQFLGLLDVGLLHDELQFALSQHVLGGLQVLVGLAEPSLHLGDALPKVRLRLVHHRHPGLGLVQASAVKRLELLEVGAHGLEEPLFLGTAATGARLVNNLKPGGGEHFVVKHLPLGWRPRARLPWEVHEQVVAHLQLLA